MPYMGSREYGALAAAGGSPRAAAATAVLRPGARAKLGRVVCCRPGGRAEGALVAHVHPPAQLRSGRGQRGQRLQPRPLHGVRVSRCMACVGGQGLCPGVAAIPPNW